MSHTFLHGYALLIGVDANHAARCCLSFNSSATKPGSGSLPVRPSRELACAPKGPSYPDVTRGC